jgi:hypothetical protein
MLGFLAASPLPAAAEFLLSIVETASREIAAAALSALLNSRHRADMQDRVSAIVAAKGDAALGDLLRGAAGS